MQFEPGVHFGLSDEEYFSVPALSASGMKNLRISPLDFWARSAWLNPNYEDDQEDASDSFARTLGKAYHKRILEGRGAFDACYAPSFDPSAHPDALESADQIKDALRRFKAQGAEVKLSGTKAELIERLFELNPLAKVMDEVRLDYEGDHNGKIFLPTKTLDKIELAAAMIEKHPDLSKAFTGGMPEVSIFWTCPVIGVNCKARLDYVKPKAIVDLKTVANTQGKPLAIAVAREFASRRYFIQGAHYDEAAKQIAGFVKSGAVHGDCDPAILKALEADHEKTTLFVFQVKGVAPAAIGRTFPSQGLIFQIAQAEIETLKMQYRTCLETFGTDPWVETSKIEAFADEEVPSWAFE